MRGGLYTFFATISAIFFFFTLTLTLSEVYDLMTSQSHPEIVAATVSAQLQTGDRIIQVDDQTVHTTSEAYSQLVKSRGEQVTLRVKRNGGEFEDSFMVPEKLEPYRDRETLFIQDSDSTSDLAQASQSERTAYFFGRLLALFLSAVTSILLFRKQVVGIGIFGAYIFLLFLLLVV